MANLNPIRFDSVHPERTYSQYKHFLLNHQRSVIVFEEKTISPHASSAVVGKLQVRDGGRSSLFKGLDLSDSVVVSNLFVGIKMAFVSRFPNGVRIHGSQLITPQIEFFDPAGDGVYYFIQLGTDAYEAAKRQ